VGLATAAQFVPMLVLSPFGGVVADRYSRRAVLLGTQTAMALTAFAMLITWTAGVRSPYVLLALVAVGGALNGINMPTWQSFVTDLVPRDYLMSAVTLNSLQFNAARSIGPAIAGVILATLGPAWAFGLNAASFLFVLVALLAVRTRPTRSPHSADAGVFAQIRDAIRYTRSEPFLIVTIVVTGLIGGLGNPIFGFTVVFAGVVYLVGPALLGLLNVAPGIGAVLSAPILSRRVGPRALSQAVRWGLPLYGVAMFVFGAWPSYAVGIVTLVIMGGAFLAVISSVNSSLQLYVEPSYRGRVMSLRLMMFTLSVAVGGLIQGWAADHIGPRLTVMVAAALLTVAAFALRGDQGKYSLSLLDGPPAKSLSGSTT